MMLVSTFISFSLISITVTLASLIDLIFVSFFLKSLLAFHIACLSFLIVSATHYFFILIAGGFSINFIYNDLALFCIFIIHFHFTLSQLVMISLFISFLALAQALIIIVQNKAERHF
jgi:hypothetical protein